MEILDLAPELALETIRRNKAIEFALGTKLLSYVYDPKIIEIMVNNDCKVWIEANGEKMRHVDNIEPKHTLNIINLVSDSAGKIINESNPSLACNFPLGKIRFQATYSTHSNPVFTMRKYSEIVFSLEYYLENNLMPECVYNTILEAVTKHKNILVVGGTGSGKTTLTNSILAKISELCPDERLAIAQDVSELFSSSANTINLFSDVFYSMQHIIFDLLRYRPDRIIINEIRDKTIVDLLMAWNTGHPGGLSTIHANSSTEIFERIESLILLKEGNNPNCNLIGQAVDLILFIQKTPKDRAITQALHCKGYDKLTQKYLTEIIYEQNV